MFLVEVALGQEKSITASDSSLTKAPPGFHSVVARGSKEPGEDESSFKSFIINHIHQSKILRKESENLFHYTTSS